MRKLRTGAMPPAGLPRPDEADLRRRWRRGSRRRSTRRRPRARQPGAPSAPPPESHRVRERDSRSAGARGRRRVAAAADDVSGGFDNNAGMLGVSPTLLERYLSAAAKISALAVGDATLIGASSQTYLVRGDASQSGARRRAAARDARRRARAPHVPARRPSTSSRRSCCRRTWVPSEVSSSRTTSSSRSTARRVFHATVGGDEDNAMSAANAADIITALDDAADRRASPITAGPHVAAAFVKRTAAQGGSKLQPFLRTTLDAGDHTGLPHVASLTITGPFDVTGPGDTPSRRRIFIVPACVPVGGAAVREDDPLHAGLTGLPSSGDRAESSIACWRSIATVGSREPSRPGSSSGCAAFLPTRSSCFAPSGIRSIATAGIGVPHRRLRAGVAAVVLPLEQHSGR